MDEQELRRWAAEMVSMICLLMRNMDRKFRLDFVECINAYAAELDFAEDPEINATETNLEAAN
jgi:hypothetical protein